MRITLDDTLTPMPPRSPSARGLSDSISSKLNRTSSYGLIRAPDIADHPLHASYLMMMSDCYSGHHAVRVAPHDLWYAVLCEIAATVNANPDAFRSLFTVADPGEKTKIEVMAADPTDLPLESLLVHLRRLVPSDIDLFIPDFSTHDEGSRTACYAAFADTVKAYYSYGTFCCGLPAVEFTGTPEDWDLFGGSLMGIANLFKPILEQLEPPSLDERSTRRKPATGVSMKYFHRVLSRVDQIHDLISGGDQKFVRDIYSHHNVGSGGEKDVTGWIADFYVNETERLDNFNPCLSMVPFTNLHDNQDYTVVYGSFWSTVEDGFRTARYGGLTYRHEPKIVTSGFRVWRDEPEPEGRWPIASRQTVNQ